MYPLGPLPVNTHVVHHFAMKRTDPQYKLRMTEDLKAKVEEAAKANNRSMNAEIVARLEASFPVDPPEDAYLKQLYDEQLRAAMLKAANEKLRDFSASMRNAFSGKAPELPETPEELASLVEARIAAEREHKAEIQRIQKLFHDAQSILRTKAAGGLVLADRAEAHIVPPDNKTSKL